MSSEAIRNVRTMREVRTSLDVIRNQRPRTTDSLSKTREEVEYLECLTDRRLDQVLEKERRRFNAQEASINKSRRRMLKSREKLAMTVNRNRALTELRRELQKARWKRNDPVILKAPTLPHKPGVRRVELQY